MSAGYASRLSAYPNKGVCGLPEQRETARAYKLKIASLAAAIRTAQPRIVVFTGAGISTSAGIPDFRGPKGAWFFFCVRAVYLNLPILDRCRFFVELLC